MVYLARLAGRPRPVALKVLPGAAFNRWENVQRLLREAKVAATLQHPNLSNFIDIGQDARELFLVMDYLEGKTLAQRLEGGLPLPVAEMADLAYQLIQVLKYLAERGITHRNVTPRNLMISNEGLLTLMDLGLAKTFEDFTLDLTITGAMLGTPTYMAPEQILDTKRASPQTDLYAAGVTILQMATGRLPFQGDSLGHLLNEILETPPPDPCKLRVDFPDSLARRVVALLDKESTARPSHDEVLADLRPFLARGAASLRQDYAAAHDRSGAVRTDLHTSVATRLEEAGARFHDPRGAELLDLLPKVDGKVRLGNYDVDGRADDDGDVRTYRAHHRLSDYPAIVRMLPPAMGQMAPEVLRGLWDQRAKLMQITTNCSELTPLVDVGMAELTEGNFRAIYYTIEGFQPGVSLAQIIRQGQALSHASAGQLLLKAVCGLWALHREGILHGNLHPGKLFCDDRRQDVAIVDLSRARSVPGARSTSDSIEEDFSSPHDAWWLQGSTLRRQYVAPELFDEGVKPSPASEQYALGVVFVEAVSGRFLPTHANDFQLLKRVREALEDALSVISEESPRLAGVLRRMAAVNPRSRYPDLAHLKDDLAADQVPSSSAGPPASSHLPQPVKPPQTKAGRDSHQRLDVFISYRRDADSGVARAIFLSLKNENIHAFLDVDSMPSGPLRRNLLLFIEESPSFLVVLSPGCLDRCQDPADWLRLEIAKAIEMKRNLIPVVMPGFTMPPAEQLPPELQPLLDLVMVPYHDTYFPGMIDKVIGYLAAPPPPRNA